MLRGPFRVAPFSRRVAWGREWLTSPFDERGRTGSVPGSAGVGRTPVVEKAGSKDDDVTGSDVLDAVQTLSLEGEAPTAERLATHISLTCQDAEPTAADIESVLDELVRAGTIRRWRIFASGRHVDHHSDWITAFTPA